VTEPTKQERAMASWRRLTPEQRDYDRFVARQIPYGASMIPETSGGRELLDAMLDDDNRDRGCSCHLNPPCSYCESLDECEDCGAWVPGDEMDGHVETKHADPEGG